MISAYSLYGVSIYFFSSLFFNSSSIICIVSESLFRGNFDSLVAHKTACKCSIEATFTNFGNSSNQSASICSGVFKKLYLISGCMFLFLYFMLFYDLLVIILTSLGIVYFHRVSPI